jgi:alpha-glucosidase (family GH31 glycosyl hydrolase)
LELYGLKMFDSKYENFGFEVHDVTDPTNWFLDTRNQTFIFADKYVQMDLKIPSWNVYGFGDRYTEFKLLPGAYNMWASGKDPQADNGKGRGGLSGVHPFVMFETNQKRRFVGLFFRNSAAMTPIITYNDDGTGLISLISIGGDIDVQIFVKGTAKEVIEEYHRYIGYPRLPPYWSLGW